jgi:sortase A
MKKSKSSWILFLIFLAGLSLLLYPVVSNYVNERHQTQAIASYEKGMAKLSKRDFTKLRQAAASYNRRLAARETEFKLSKAETAEYNRLLDPTGSGIMGYIDIKTIGVTLPIYHGVSDPVLEVGAGHLPGSSLPVGGESTHCVLSGHRGLPSARLFTDLDQVQKGDVFVLHVLDRALAYKVDQIVIVEPEDTSELEITGGKDYCTLVTCTPYGINTHRLLVRGHRVPYTGSEAVDGDARAVDPMLVATAIAAPVLVGLLIHLLATTGRPRRKKKDGGDR